MRSQLRFTVVSALTLATLLLLPGCSDDVGGSGSDGGVPADAERGGDGSIRADASAPDMDAALLDEDGGVEHADASTHADGSTAEEDGGASDRDASSGLDGAVPTRDAGVSTRDAGVSTRDAGVSTRDAGVAPRDSCVATRYYPDCDGDGYAPMGPGTLSCGTPAAPPCSGSIGGSGAWITRAPAGVSQTDCNDRRADVNPSITAYSAMPIPGAPMSVDYDYDCNATEEPERVRFGVCRASPGGCEFSEGWSPDGSLPACGATRPYYAGCRFVGGSCTLITMDVTQRCR